MEQEHEEQVEVQAEEQELYTMESDEYAYGESSFEDEVEASSKWHDNIAEMFFEE